MKANEQQRPLCNETQELKGFQDTISKLDNEQKNTVKWFALGLMAAQKPQQAATA